jgi:hypothetical protein
MDTRTFVNRGSEVAPKLPVRKCHQGYRSFKRYDGGEGGEEGL